MRTRLLMILTALDALAFALICLGNVRQGEYASSAAWDCLRQAKWQGRVFVPIIDAIFFFDPDHCLGSWQDQKHLYLQIESKTSAEEFR